MITGQPQAGKSCYIFAIALMNMLDNMSQFLIVRNYLEDATATVAKVIRFSTEHKEHMKTLGYIITPSLEPILCDDQENVNNAFTEKKLIILLNNESQLTKIEKSIISENAGPICMLIDEADAIGYGNPGNTVTKTYNKLLNLCLFHVEISATPADILVGNINLLTTAVYPIPPPGTYKGIGYVTLEILSENANTSSETREKVLNRNLDNHPNILLDKSTTRNAKQGEIFKTVREENKFTVIIENSEGTKLYSRNITESIFINGEECKYIDGIIHFTKQIIPEILQWLYDNGGIEKFPNIVIISGHFSGRARSYVSSNGIWHLTDQYYPECPRDMSSALQGQRMLHDRPDNIPLILHTTLQIFEDLQKSDKLQQDILYKMTVDIENTTSEHMKCIEVYKEKVPKKNLTSRHVNKGFKITTTNNPNDGGYQYHDNDPVEVFGEYKKINKDKLTADRKKIYDTLCAYLSAQNFDGVSRNFSLSEVIKNTFHISDKNKITNNVWNWHSGVNNTTSQPANQDTPGLLFIKGRGDSRWKVRYNRNG